MDPIVSREWLLNELDSRSDFAIVHVGTTMTGGDPHEGFLAGHLPGARFVSLDDDLAGPPGPTIGRHPLPTAEAFAASMAATGVDHETRVIAYDDRGGAFAGRLVWMLRVIGQDAALLDGGAESWPGPIEVGPVRVDAAARSPIEWPTSAIADADVVADHVASGGIVVDSRAPERFRGEVEPIDAVAGHVPGAVNLPFDDNLDNGRFRSVRQLRERFAAIEHDPDAIVYCGSGVTACHNALAIEAAGFPRPRVYVGSWSGWSTDPARDVETGAPPES